MNNKVITNKNFKKLVEVLEQKRQNDFNIFKVLRLENYEVRHSNFLAWLFDNAASHKMGITFFEKCFKTCFPYKNINLNEKIKIETEYYTDKERRIDILIIGETFTCTIENKYGSCEHGGQCQHYREFINNKFKDKNNYYIFLDIEKPENFETETFSGYQFLSYKDILNILNGLNLNNSIENIVIQQYIEILKEKYEPINTEIKELCKSINNIDDILYLDDNKLSDSEKTAKNTLKNYQWYIKQENDKKIESILKGIVKDKNVVRKHNKDYAFVIQTNYGLLNQIDFTASEGLEIAFYVGLKVPNSRELVRYISKTPKFFQNLNKLLSDKNWLGKFKLCVNDASGFHEMFYLDCNISNIQNQQILREYINKHPNIVGKNSTEKIENIIKELITLSGNKLFEQYQIDYAIPKLKNKKVGNFVWKLVMYYTLGINNTKNETEIAKIYKEKTLACLEILGKAEDFKEKFLND